MFCVSMLIYSPGCLVGLHLPECTELTHLIKTQWHVMMRGDKSLWCIMGEVVYLWRLNQTGKWGTVATFFGINYGVHFSVLFGLHLSRRRVVSVKIQPSWRTSVVLKP